MKLTLAWLTILTAVLVAAGCGEKIAIPQPVGLFSVSAYIEDGRFPDTQPRQIAAAQGALFVLNADSLTKRDQEYGRVTAVGGFADPRSICVDETGQIIFVYDQAGPAVSWYAGTDLALLGETILPQVLSGASLAVCGTGIEQVPGARTFLYVSDPDSGVVHRFVFDDFAGLTPYGILARSDGDAARFVHEAAGLARDSQDSLLVCDVDTNRNWVIRFVSEPDVTDVTSDPDDEDPLRGHAALFASPTCVPPAAADYVLGNAATCGQNDWVGAPSDLVGEFHTPTALAVDGMGRIFVADRGNNRLQVFDSYGNNTLIFGSPESTPGPISTALVDVRIGSGATAVNFAAFVYVILADSDEVVRFISSEHYTHLNQEPPPPPQ